MSNESSLHLNSYVDSPNIVMQDKVFESVAKAIFPSQLTLKNQEVIDSFISLIVQESPISVNIIDFFNKNSNVESIQNVQNELANMYLNNFFYVWNKAKNDYQLRQRLSKIVEKYKTLPNSNITDDDVNFFANEKEMYTHIRYILGREFKQKKGTETAIEYAYKLAWEAKIEGNLRNDYDFSIKKISQTSLGITDGAVICPNTTGIQCGVSPSGYGKQIGTFTISDTVDGSVSQDEAPFYYEVTGSMLPEIFEAFVIPLAHPVGFNYIYKRIFEMKFADYFNLTPVYKADKVSVQSQCPNGDCSVPMEDVYALKEPGGGISNSWLVNIENYIEGTAGPYQAWSVIEYIFNNGYRLKTYTDIVNNEVVARVIEYLDNSNNVIRTYTDEENASISLTNPSAPELIWDTVDDIAFEISSTFQDSLNDSLASEILLGPAIIGQDIMINKLYYLPAHYQTSQGNIEINIQAGKFIDYDISTIGTGKLNARYVALQDKVINLSTENFPSDFNLPTSQWQMIISDVTSLPTTSGSITPEKTFVVGGNSLVASNIDTSHMTDYINFLHYRSDDSIVVFQDLFLNNAFSDDYKINWTLSDDWYFENDTLIKPSISQSYISYNVSDCLVVPSSNTAAQFYLNISIESLFSGGNIEIIIDRLGVLRTIGSFDSFGPKIVIGDIQANDIIRISSTGNVEAKLLSFQIDVLNV